MTYSNSLPLSYEVREPLSYKESPHPEAVQYNTPQMYGEQPVYTQVQQYENPQVYPEYHYYEESPKKKSSVPAALAGAGLGLIGGGIAGAVKKNPYMVNGVPTDMFAQLSYEKYLKKAPEVERKAYSQTNEIINNVIKMKNTDELKTLLNNNSEGAKEVATALNKTTEEYLNTVSETNLAANKEVIKKKLEIANTTRFQNMKNEITRAWDGEKKKFVKPGDMDENMFKAIKRTSGKVRAKFIASYAAVAAVATGVLAFVIHKIVTHRKQSHQ